MKTILDVRTVLWVLAVTLICLADKVRPRSRYVWIIWIVGPIVGFCIAKATDKNFTRFRATIWIVAFASIALCFAFNIATAGVFAVSFALIVALVASVLIRKEYRSTQS